MARDAATQEPLPYRQVIGSHCEAPPATLLEQLRPAIHTYASSPPPEAKAIFALADKDFDLPHIHGIASAWRQKYRALMVVGAGGSGLSGKALAMLCNGPHLTLGQPALHVLDNLDAFTLPHLFGSMDLRHTCFLLVSKSGSTVETLAQTHLLLAALKEKGITSLAEHMMVIAMQGDNPLRALAAEHSIPTLEHDPHLCGRFSILSAAGLIPAAFMGLNIDALHAGAACALKANLLADSPAATGAALQVAQLLARRNVNLMMPYGERLGGLALWWRQSWAESLGKTASGSTPVIAAGTCDQHSQLQMFLGGPDDKFFTFLLADCAGFGLKLPETVQPAFLAGRTLGDIVAAHQRATVETLERYGRPLRVFEIAKADEFTLGALLMHFTLEILFAAALLGVNPFDQPAVEESKRLAYEYLRKMP